jgi:hypothetical protein
MPEVPTEKLSHCFERDSVSVRLCGVLAAFTDKYVTVSRGGAVEITGFPSWQVTALCWFHVLPPHPA